MTELSEPLAGRHIVHFRHHDPHYSRNRIMVRALSLSGADVTQIADGRTFLWRTPRLLRRVAHEDFDAILVGFPSHSDVPVARAVGRLKGIPVLFDPSPRSGKMRSLIARRLLRGALGRQALDV